MGVVPILELPPSLSVTDIQLIILRLDKDYPLLPLSLNFPTLFQGQETVGRQQSTSRNTRAL